MTPLPAAAQQALAALHTTPPWLASLVLLALGVAAALAVHAAGVALARRALRSQDDFWRSLVMRSRRPSRLALVAIGLSFGARAAPLSPAEADLFQHGMLIAVILLVGWIALTALDIAATLYMRGVSLEADDNLLARKQVTQVRILHRAAATVVVLMTIGLALMTIGAVRQWGVSLLAAGGAAGLIVGLALQPLLANLIAGIQIAMTQPIRIDDAVIVEGEWGRIEEIRSTYVVVRIWDLRRMVLPLTYFIQTPFQNWTRESACLIGTALLYVDYAAPVEAMRARLEAIVRASPLWDGQVVALQVTDLRERVMEIRCLASGRNASDTFDLRCIVREDMVAFLRDSYPEALPRDRLDVSLAAGREG